jgi:ribosomal protein S18 acetylase RimI-like enzyme
MLDVLKIRPLEPDDQPAARDLVLAGLAERWGWLDENLNADLNDIAASYSDGVFVTAWLRSDLVGTGALVPEGDHIWRIERMSVAAVHRQCGIGSRLLQRLLAEAAARCAQRVVLETTSTWTDAIAFYQHHGFQVEAVRDGETHMALDLLRRP